MKLSLRSRHWLLVILFFPVMDFIARWELKEVGYPYITLLVFLTFGLLIYIIKCPTCKSTVTSKPIGKYKKHLVKVTVPWVPKNCYTCGERLP